MIFIRKDEKTLGIIRQWLDVFESDFSLVTDAASISPNLAGFIEHRHDQSVLSLLLKTNKAATIPAGETYHTDWGVLEKEYPVLSKRDLQ